MFIYGPASSGGAKDGETGMRDTAATIASIQRGFDESINVGDLYRIGSALAVCIDRDDPFISSTEYEGEAGNTMEAKFQVVDNGNKELPGPARGQIEVFDEDDINPDESAVVQGKLATETSHIFRVSVGAVALERAARVIEIGFRSTLGIKSSGITTSTALKQEKGLTVHPRKTSRWLMAAIRLMSMLNIAAAWMTGKTRTTTPTGTRSSPKYSASDDRYSFFRLYRNLDSNSFTQSTISMASGIRPISRSTTTCGFSLRMRNGVNEV